MRFGLKTIKNCSICQRATSVWPEDEPFLPKTCKKFNPSFNMRILLAFDSFKESLTSLEAARCFQEGFLKILPQTQIETLLLSDGGEGFVEALIFQQGEVRHETVTSPLGTPRVAHFGWIPEKKTAVIEMATASGLELVPVAQRNPLKTTSYGTGELIQAGLRLGAQHFYIGIGGSATVDGGMGMAQALGVKFFNKAGDLLDSPLTGSDLSKVAQLSVASLSSELKKARFTIACDVDNPWVGAQGAARVFGPQKGATPEKVEFLEEGMENLAKVMRHNLEKDIASLAGGGAAGGLGGMLHALFNAELKSGIDIVLEQANFEHYAQSVDLIVTGEGRIDFQTLRGKTISGITKIAKKHQTPVLAIGGSLVEEALPPLYEAGISAAFSLLTAPMSLEEAIVRGQALMKQTGESVARLMLHFPKSH